MSTIAVGGQEDILALETADQAASASPTEEKDQIIQPEDLLEDLETTPSEPVEKSKTQESESDPDEELLKILQDKSIPLGKSERFQKVIEQKRQAQARIAELEAALKNSSVPGSNAKETVSNPVTQKVTEYSDDFEELLAQIEAPEFAPIFDYVYDDKGLPTGYKNPADEPKSVEDMMKAMYPQIEKNILKRVGQAQQIRSQKQEELQKVQKDGEAQIKQEIEESFADDIPAYEEYIKSLEEDYAEFKRKYPTRPFDVKAHHEFYMNRIYRKASTVNPENLETAKKISRTSTKADLGQIEIRDPQDILNL